VKHDGVLHELHLSQFEVPRCQNREETIITSAADEQINDTLRSRLGLLTPEQIRAGINRLGLTSPEIAARLDVAPETLSRWANGALIPSKAMNNLLRAFFAFPEVRELLRGDCQILAFGTEVR
jgi:DNA-binding transcriptional regulator YiaG